MAHQAGAESLNGVAGQSGDTTASDKIPFEAQLLGDFVSLLASLFFDDAAAVVAEQLSRDQCAYTEADLRDRLKWMTGENFLNARLFALEQSLIVVRDSGGAAATSGGESRGGKATTYWRISEWVAYAAEYRLNLMMEKLQEACAEATHLYQFQCAPCGLSVSELEAASGRVRLDDEHPLCRRCGQPLTLSDSEAVKSARLERLQRGKDQLADLLLLLPRVKAMQLPRFPCYTRSTKNAKPTTGSPSPSDGASSKPSSLIGGL
eukprot:Selendium_serpulae@DN4739_c0_g1_i1.p1